MPPTPSTVDPSVVTRIQRRMSCLNYPVEIYQLEYYLVEKHPVAVPSIQALTSTPSEDIAYRYDDSKLYADLGPTGAGFALDIINELRRLSPLVDSYYQQQGVSFRINGLEFAKLSTPKSRDRWSLQVGVGEKKAMPVDTPLPVPTSMAVREWVHKLATYRVPTGNKKTNLYQLMPEHWLESIILKKPTLISPDLTALVTQVATNWVATHGKDIRHFMDGLALDTKGRLAVIELKVKPDIHAVLQAVDYWLWAEQNKGELQVNNYFPQLPLNTALPTSVFLVAPEGQFHQLIPQIAAALKPDIPLKIVELPRNWRLL